MSGPIASAPRPKARPPAYGSIQQRGDYASASGATPVAQDAFTFIGPWVRVDLAASLTNDSLLIANVGSARLNMPWDGYVAALSVRSSAARTAGTATFDVFKNGSALAAPLATSAVLDGTHTQNATAYYQAGQVSFLANDQWQIVVTTTAAWAPTTADINVNLYVVFKR